MPGRKKPERTEAEKTHEYIMFEKRQAGEKLQGEQAEWLDEEGAVGEVKEERRRWRATHPDGEP